ncbi:PREDICTED: uncharacterized protein LOC105959695 [Erythranthe guttata]|uniref:uncharacterized protein LOC105959695 n=1 Tax=Erythranthe guttata TaxID=4155 RepID=UPI00064E10B1|nr:PREDICTED: uncharacterized protein LOC105959695 [Erythranthe guttata]|eukprot:XP_012839288.1 PREDICTED: uncharacterized protein LOC105959695 [Erythranthe guttata]
MKALSGKGDNPEDPDRIGDRDVLASARRRKQLAREAALQREEERLRREAVAAGAGPCGPARDLQLARSTLPHADDDDDHNNNPDNMDTDEEMEEDDEPADVYQDRRGGRALPFPQLPGPAYLEGPCEGGPQNYEFMRWFKSHIAMYIWEGYERRETTRYESRTKALEDYRGPQDNTMIARLEATGLYHLRDCFLKRMNKNLMLAFVERWQPETNSFHMSWGEMTITLHDVAFILALRLDGPAVSEIRPVEECSQSLASVLGVGLMDTNEMFRNNAGSLSISPAFDHLFPVHIPSLSLDAEGGPMVEGIKPCCRNTGKKLDAMTERDVSNNFSNYVYSRVTDFSN